LVSELQQPKADRHRRYLAGRVAEHARERAATGSGVLRAQRAFWVTFRNADGTDVRHHFEVDADGSIQVWEHWLTKRPLIMRGQIVSPDQLRLEGVGSQPGGPLVLIRQGGAR